MQKLLCFVSVILISGLVEVDSLQCYICDDCPTPTDDDLKTCGDPGTTLAPPQTPVNPPGTTLATPQTPPGTSNATPETTVAPPGTTVVPPVTTAAPSETTAVPPVTTVATPVTTVASPDTTAVSQPPEGSRSKRSVLSPHTRTGSDECKCKNVAGCECDGKLLSDRMTPYQDIEYVCFKAEGNGTIFRGCIAASIGCTLQEVLNLTHCSTCDTDKCNGSYTVQLSAFLLIATSCLMLLK